jgi:hypothetical protein
LTSKSDSTDFYTAADDNEYYMASCGKYLNSLKVKQISKESRGVLLFKARSSKIFKMGLDTLYWGIILFNGKTKPIVADMTDIVGDYHRYMKN